MKLKLHSNKIVPIILAAGRGSRMKRLTKNKPKSFVKIDKSKRLIDKVIENFVSLDFKKITLITGYKSSQFNEFKKINNLPKTGEKIVVAMSGGVDSSVTAAILNHLGYEVIGVSMKLYEASKVSASKTCCSGKDIRDARTVAKKIGIKHFIVDYKSRFKQSVIENFIESYNKGHTPIPCIKCNQTVKFKDMIDFSKSIGCPYLATGHYVKRIEEDGRIHLYQANDKTKDQSYFLFATTQNQLKTLRFPLGYFTKQEIRNLAKFFSLDVADKPDSQDICFIPDGNYRDFLKKHSTSSFKQGVIETVDGTSLGFHDGLANYTIGQRKGIGIGGIKGQTEHRPFYVVDINLKNNKVIVGPKDKLKKYFIYLKDLNFCSGDLPLKPFKATIKIRPLFKINTNIQGSRIPTHERLKRPVSSSRVR